jgi:hypothetical protein
MVQHPLDKLSVRGGELFYNDGSSLGPMPYLDTPMLTIEARDRCHDVGGDEVLYSFKLSGDADETWRELFKRTLEGAKAAVIGSSLELQCIPANLQSHYSKVKEALRQTNNAYVEHKTAIIHDVEQITIRREQKQQAEEMRRQTLREQFETLEL